MFHVINFIAVILVSAAVVYHYIVFDKTTKKTKQEIQDARVDAENAVQNVNSSLTKTKKELSNEITNTKGTLKQTNTDLQQTQGDLEATKATTTQLNTDFTAFNNATTTSLTELNKQDTELNNSLNTFFKTLDEQIKTKNLQVSDTTNLNGQVNIKGGKSKDNPNNWMTHFAHIADGKNYIRGDTELRGNMDLVGSIQIMKPNPGAMVERNYTNAHTGDRYGVGQFPGGAMRMYTAGEHAPATTNLSVALKDGKFNDVVSVNSDGSTDVNGMLRVNRTKSNKYPNGWGAGIHTIDVYANGTIATGQNGNFGATIDNAGNINGQQLNIRNDIVKNGGNNWIIHTPDDGRTSMWIAPSSAFGNQNWSWENSLKLDANGRVNSKELCLDNVCINKEQLKAIKTNARV